MQKEFVNASEHGVDIYIQSRLMALYNTGGREKIYSNPEQTKYKCKNIIDSVVVFVPITNEYGNPVSFHKLYLSENTIYEIFNKIKEITSAEVEGMQDEDLPF